MTQETRVGGCEQVPGPGEEAEERLQRMAADFENFRRRSADLEVRARDRERREVLRPWLEVVDNLERAIGADHVAGEGDALRTGVEAILRLARGTLSAQSAERMDVVGQRFDPALHEAVGSAAGEEGVIVAEVRAGYLLGDEPLRPARVIVGDGEQRQ